MAKIISNTESTINWDIVITNLGSGKKRTQEGIWENKEALPNTPAYNAYLEVFQRLADVGYRISDIFWHDYYSDDDYSHEIDQVFGEKVEATFLRSWISKIDPGRNVPYHWDVDDKSEEWKKLGRLVRYTCFIDKPRWGSAFIIEDELFYGLDQGTVVEWDNWYSYHAGTNAGKDPQYLYHFLGYK